MAGSRISSSLVPEVGSLESVSATVRASLHPPHPFSALPTAVTSSWIFHPVLRVPIERDIAKFGYGGTVPVMDVSLPPELEKLLSEKVKSGLYQSPSEMIREGLRLLEERDRLYQLRLEELRREIRKGLESGPAVPGSQVFRELRAKAQRRRRPKRK